MHTLCMEIVGSVFLWNGVVCISLSHGLLLRAIHNLHFSCEQTMTYTHHINEATVEPLLTDTPELRTHAL